MKKAAVAMSGGVDSSLSAQIMRDAGYTVIGVTFLMNDFTSDAEAKSAAAALGIEHHTVDLRDVFRREVIDSFISEYEDGETPNPCVTCNTRVKFPYLFKFMREHSCCVAVTGHYARIAVKDGRRFIKCGVDFKKDQSYMLWGISPAELENLSFPLGEMSKDEVRALAEKYNIPSAHTKDSQDICFVPDGDYSAFITKKTGKNYPCGTFYSESGKLLAPAGRVIDYTIGQRRGLGYAAGERVFVLSKNTATGKIVIGGERGLYRRVVYAKNVNLFFDINSPERFTAKVRYGKTAADALIAKIGDSELVAIFDEPVRAPAAGQSLVIYNGDVLIGGGVIFDL